MIVSAKRYTGNVVNRLLPTLIAAVVFCAAAPSQNATTGPSSITVTGDVATPLTLKAEDLAAMPREKAVIPDQDGTTIEYEGVPLREILKKAGAPLGSQLRGSALTTYVLAKAADGYQVVYSLGEIDASFGNAKILVVDKRDGKSLFDYQGPFRIVCPDDKAGARSVRMLSSLEVVRLKK
jgi:DMSO/TMAO reductase YedYZ molybdopterin-dependent catalytic subunit